MTLQGGGGGREEGVTLVGRSQGTRRGWVLSSYKNCNTNSSFGWPCGEGGGGGTGGGPCWKSDRVQEKGQVLRSCTNCNTDSCFG